MVITTALTSTPTPTENTPTPAEQLLRSVTSCDVREILFAANGVAYIKFRDGDRSQVRLGKADADEIFATAQEQRCTDFDRIIVAIE